MKKTFLLKMMLLLCVLVMGGVSSTWATTYKLTKVTSVSAGNKYVFERNSHVLNNTVSSDALQTTGTYSKTGLTGTETYIWELESATGGFYLKNTSLKTTQYLNNTSTTKAAFGNKNSVWTIAFTSGVALISNSSNSNRFLGETGSGYNTYKAYATSNLSSYGHDFTVYLVEEEVSITSVTIKTAPTKTRYEVGESLDMSGFVLDVNSGTDVSDGYTMKIGDSAIEDGATLSSAGKKTITVTYGGHEVYQNISVGAVTSIAVTTPPAKTSYDTGDSFDPAGMVVTASLSTGELSEPDTWTKDVTGYTVDPENNLAPANTSVTIAYATKTTTQTITVTNVAVTSVSVKASTTIEKGKTETLTATITPGNATNKAVTWESDDTDVATVSDAGVVTAKAAGTANITVTTVDGGKTATCVVTVVNEKGSIDAPFTVADVINGDAASKTGKYFIGYIVGNYNSTSPIKSGSSLAETNLALADNPDETVGSKTIPVELSSGSGYRATWGPKNKSHYIGATKILIVGNGQTYFSTNGIKGASSITAVAEIVKVADAGFATYASDFGLDYSGLDVKAYKATISGTDIAFTKVTEVPAGEGVLLQNEGTVEVPVKSVSSWAADDNAFVRGTGAAVETGTGPYNYILNKVGGVVGFYKAANQTVATNRAYLQSETAAARISLNFDDEEANGISATLMNSEERIVKSIYNLAGQRVAQPTKGLYIKNGRKVIVK